jgi:hypothetical protein
MGITAAGALTGSLSCHMCMPCTHDMRAHACPSSICYPSVHMCGSGWRDDGTATWHTLHMGVVLCTTMYTWWLRSLAAAATHPVSMAIRGPSTLSITGIILGVKIVQAV